LTEDEEGFTWAFKAFEDDFGIAPKVIFTDQDQAMDCAITALWPNTVHLLCTFHIWKNFWKHIKPLFGDKKTAEWNEVAKQWWKLCKNSDESAITSFATDWDDLVTYITANGTSGDAWKNKKRELWLANLKDLAPKWAACYTWQQKTYGIHSTQRAEAVNSAIATFCKKTSTIVLITTDLEQLAETQRLESEVEEIRKTIYRDVSDKDLSPLATFLVQGLHPWAKRNVVGQVEQQVHYQCNLVPGGTRGIFSVKRIGAEPATFSSKIDQRDLERAIDHGVAKSSFTTHQTSIYSCSCQYEKCYGGLPCRHRAAVAQQLGPDQWQPLRESIHAFWIVKSLDPGTRQQQQAVNDSSIIQQGGKKRNKKMRKTELNRMAKALAELACESDALTDEVLALLKEKLTSLSLVTGVNVPDGPIVANPPAKAKSQNQKRIEPGAAMEPTMKARGQFVKKQTKEMKKKNKQSKKDTIG
jgi:MULE transposase domain/SWIM zinc finger